MNPVMVRFCLCFDVMFPQLTKHLSILQFQCILPQWIETSLMFERKGKQLTPQRPSGIFSIFNKTMFEVRS